MKRTTLKTALLLTIAVILAPVDASAQFRSKGTSSRSSSKSSFSPRSSSSSRSFQSKTSNRSSFNNSRTSSRNFSQPKTSSRTSSFNKYNSNRNTSSRNFSQPKTTSRNTSTFNRYNSGKTSSSRLQTKTSSSFKKPTTSSFNRNSLTRQSAPKTSTSKLSTSRFKTSKPSTTSTSKYSGSRGTTNSKFNMNRPITNNIPKTRENWKTGTQLKNQFNKSRIPSTDKSTSPFSTKAIEATKGKKMGIFPGERPTGRPIKLGGKGSTKSLPTLGSKTTGKSSLYDAINGKNGSTGKLTTTNGFTKLKSAPKNFGNPNSSSQNNPPQDNSSNNSGSNNNSNNAPQYLPKPQEQNSGNSGGNNSNPFGFFGDAANAANDALNNTGEAAGNALGNAGNAINDAVNNAGNAANDAYNNANDATNGLLDDAVDAANPVGAVTKAVETGTKIGQYGLEKGGEVINKGKEAGQWAADKVVEPGSSIAKDVAESTQKGVGLATKWIDQTTGASKAVEKGKEIIGKGKQVGDKFAGTAQDAIGTVAEDPIGFGNNLKDAAQRGVGQTTDKVRDFIWENGEKAFDAGIKATGNDPERTKDVILDRAGQAGDYINQGRDAADKLANDPEFRQEFATKLKDRVANQAKERVDNVAEAGKNVIDQASNVADVLLGNNRPTENNNEGKNPGNNGGPAQVIDDGTTAVDVEPPARGSNVNTGNKNNNGGKGDVNGREPGNGQLTIEDILNGGKNPGKGNGREPGNNNDDNNNGGNQNGGGQNGNDNNQNDNAEPPANNDGGQQDPPMNTGGDNNQNPPVDNGGQNGDAPAEDNNQNPPADDYQDDYQDNGEGYYEDDYRPGKQVIIDIIANLPVGGGFAQPGPVVAPQPIFIDQPVAVPVAPAAPVVEDNRIRTDLEVLDIRFVDLGDATKNEGPRFRVFLKNHNNKFALTKVEVALVAGIELAKEGTVRKVKVEILESIAADSEATIDIRLPREVLALAKDANGNNVPFSGLAVIADPEQKFNDVKPENNILVRGLEEVEQVELKLEKLSSTKLQATGKLVLTGEGFDFKTGAVVLVVNKKGYPMTITEWAPTKIEATVPNFVLMQDMDAQLVVVRGDKNNTAPQAVKLLK